MKKVSYFLNSVIEGLKRTCVAKALAVFAVASVTTSSFAQTTETTQSVINGVEDFVGLTPEQVTAAAVDKGKFSFEDKTKVVFLYNVKTGKFINVGGYWGTCTDLHEYGKAMWVNVNGSYLRFAVDNVNDTGNCLGYVFGVANERDRDVFVDRGSDADKASSSDWTIEPISGDAKNTVKISTTIKSIPTVTEKEDYSDQLGKKYYLSANPAYDGTNVSCSAYENPTDGYDTWRIFTYDQIYEAQKGSVNNMKTALELSFRLKCPSFERNDNDIVNWNTYDFKTKDLNKTGFAKFGLENVYCNSAKWGENEVYDADNFSDKTFSYEFDGTTYTNSADYRCYLGKYYCSSITGKCGMVYQDIDITLPGTYVIECKGYSNTTKAKLFAGVLDPGKPNYMVSGTMNKTVFNQVSNMSAEEQEALHTADHNMDYAGKAFYDDRKYVNNVVLTVPESAFLKSADGTDKYESVKIRLGVMTGEYNADNTQVEAPKADEWTVFDDFRLQYASTHTAQDLVLDEMRDNLNYLVNTTNTYENTTLHLNKTLTKNKWNSLVLPVSLTKDQLQSAFGANVRLAKLKTLTSTAIEFESVKLNDIEYTDVALDAYMPYIIFPEKEKTESNSASYTASLTVEGKNEPIKVNVPADHYTIAKVTNVDLSKINPNGGWTTTLVETDDHSIAAYGTFARTFGKYTEKEDGTYTDVTEKGTIISGRDPLYDCYFFDKGNMYHSGKKEDNGRARGLRGFSCWFKPLDTTKAQNVSFTLDGVTPNGTTGIEDILADYEQPVSRFANGVYNLNGQLVKQGNSTAGLPSGMYIVGGKKCIVR